MSSRHGGPAGGQPRPAPSGDLAAARELDPAQTRQILAELQQKLESLPTIEQAKGILMARFSLDAERAFSLLVRWSQVNNLKLRSISDALVDAADDAATLDRTIDRLQQRTPQDAAPRPEQVEGRS
jgi:hypothetical protein